MKKFLIILLFATIFDLPAMAQTNESPSDSEFYANSESGNKDMSIEQRINRMLEIAKFFDEKYPENSFETEEAKDDIIEDIKALDSNISEEDAINLQKHIISALKIYRLGQSTYKKYLENIFTSEPPLIVEDSDIADTSPTDGYVESENSDDVVVITDIKKIVPYSNNYRDIEALTAKTKRDGLKADKAGDFDDIAYILSRLEWKKLPFYDVIYPNPITGNKGIGKWQKKDKDGVRIITQQTAVKDAPQLSGVVDVLLPKGKSIIANEGRYHKPRVDFSPSENIKNWKVYFPFPVRLIDEQTNDWSVYPRQLAMPFTLEVADTEKPVILKAEVTLDICDKEQNCHTEVFTPELRLETEYSRKSAVSNYVEQSHFKIPAPSSEFFQISHSGIREAENLGKYLQIEFLSQKKISDFAVFIDSPDNIAFEAPRIKIDDKEAIVKFLPLDTDADLTTHNFEVRAILNNKYTLHQTIVPQKDDTPRDSVPVLSLQLLWWAFLGGLILNLMPCVFPVLSIKLLSLTKFGARQNSAVRHNFYYTVLGIFCAMLLLAIILSLLKYLGYAVGWGMQFQNPYFVVTMIFAVMLFLLILNDVIMVQIPNKLQSDISSNSSDGLIHFVTGSLVVLMATPCTAPYLGTVIGFALAGSIVDIFAIFGGIALGLALPYMLLYFCPWLIHLLPTPGPWMKKLNRIMGLMLFITMMWLFSVLAAQTDFGFIIRLGFYLLFAALLLWFKSVAEETEYTQITLQQKEKALKIIKIIILLLTFSLYTAAIIDVTFAYERHHLKLKETTVETLDETEIPEYIKQGKTVVVAVGADWCLTCKYNDFTVFNLPVISERLHDENIVFIKVDWTDYNRDVLHFMEKYHRSGLPFYIIFSPLIPEGMVLPEILDNQDFSTLIKNFTLKPKDS